MLSYAGIILVFLAIFVPLAMVIRLRRAGEADARYRTEGGMPMLVFTLLFGVFLLVSQLI